MEDSIAIRRIVLYTALVGLLIAASNVSAYETEWDDPAYGETTASGTGDVSPLLKNSRFRADGEIWSAYEFNDRSRTGEPDPAGPTATQSGFRIGRGYINLRGDVIDGAYTGWGFRITADFAPAATLADGCAADGNAACSGNNTNTAFLKFAYVNIPLYRGALGVSGLRLGLQEIPLSHAQAGISLQNIWGHRYLDLDGRQSFQEFGFSSSADTGLSILHGADYFAAHLLLANGEGLNKVSAQDVRNQGVSNLARGAGDSRGLDLYGNLAVRPTGKNKSTELVVAFPFRLRNITGIDGTEQESSSVDLSNPTAPRWTIDRGDARARRDVYFGTEVDGTLRTGDFSFTLGVGAGTFLDKRGEARRYDQTGVDPANLRSVGTNIAVEEDARGTGRFIFAHAKYGPFGVFARYSAGTGNGSFDGRVGAASGKPWLARAINADASDGRLGNLTHAEADRIDLGGNEFRKLLFGVTYIANQRFRVSLGFRRVTETDAQGREIRVNALERVPGQGTSAGRTLSDQLETNAALKQSLGLRTEDALRVNDYIGKRREDRQVFIRTQYLF